VIRKSSPSPRSNALLVASSNDSVIQQDVYQCTYYLIAIIDLVRCSCPDGRYIQNIYRYITESLRCITLTFTGR